jgi:hypothetical protein
LKRIVREGERGVKTETYKPYLKFSTFLPSCKTLYDEAGIAERRLATRNIE